MGLVVTQRAVLEAVDQAFRTTARDLARWSDPHPDRSPRDEEYSRLTDATKWRIVGARADAWLLALVEAGLAEVERHAPVRWHVAPSTTLSRVDRAVPRADGALPLIVARSRIGDVEDAGVTLGIGDPAVCIGWIPDCGCDACDSGSQDVLDHLDQQILGVVTGAIRRLSSGDRTITVVRGEGRSTSGIFARGEVDAVLRDPGDWHEVTGTSWIRGI
jgi:hypothetical protein